MIYFTSDQHFNHRRIIELCKRPFSSIEEMNNELIKRWNSKVTKKDIIYILGDFGFFNDFIEIDALTNKLNYKELHLIIGNHDNLNILKHSTRFKTKRIYYELKYNNQKFILFHYPIWEWNGFYNNSIHLFGHTHNSKMDGIFDYNRNVRWKSVAVDMNDFYPISIDEILKQMENINNIKNIKSRIPTKYIHQEPIYGV